MATVFWLLRCLGVVSAILFLSSVEDSHYVEAWYVLTLSLIYVVALRCDHCMLFFQCMGGSLHSYSLIHVVARVLTM